LSIGLADRLVDDDSLMTQALILAEEIAAAAPLAVESIRATLRGDIADRVRLATAHEMAEQMRLRQTKDFTEGAKAMAERRTPHFNRS
ncbi:MAG: enoyl-CoA hydratase/isomerase family protein, partial [Actinobacteria bacterium]|nr:enoyl-CoA hydratase/isomerase family protein [Actinomycetota bacterium]